MNNKNDINITVGIPTRNRYNELSHTLMSVVMQTVKPYEIIIVDDTDDPKDLRNIDTYKYIFELMNQNNIKYRIIFGKKQGPHYSHQTIQELSCTDWIFRIDDDEIAEPNVLEELRNGVERNPNARAVAPLVLMPGCGNEMPPSYINNAIKDIHLPNIQWFKWKGEKKVEHLYSCFLYRKGIAEYELSLSQKAFREETIFSHRIYRKGYDLIVNADAIVWHFRCNSGGIR